MKTVAGWELSNIFHCISNDTSLTVMCFITKLADYKNDNDSGEKYWVEVVSDMGEVVTIGCRGTGRM